MTKKEITAKLRENGIRYSNAESEEALAGKLAAFEAGGVPAVKVRTEEKIDKDAEQASEQSKASGTVTVMCALPNGLEVRTCTEGAFKLNGLSAAEIVAVKGNNRYGTTVITRAQWDWFTRIFKDHPLLVNSIVFAEEKHDRAIDKAKELGGSVKTGLEQAGMSSVANIAPSTEE